MIDFDKIKTLKTLGSGMYGTTYLAKYQNKKYALKIQKILPEHRTKNFKNDMWRELDLYRFIDKLEKKDQVFFTKLYAYHFYDNCDYQPNRPVKIDLNDTKNEFAQKLKKLDESEWCVKYLTQYQGDTNLETFLKKHQKLSSLQLYSLVLQICKIVKILYQAGYSHNDLHLGNLMINPTKKKTFDFFHHKIPYFGYQISAIDYGEVLHRKFKINYQSYLKLFLTDRDRWFFGELFYNSMFVLDGSIRLINDCEKQKKILPWNRKGNAYNDGIKMIIQNHPDFYLMVKDKYFQAFPKSKKIVEMVISKINSKKSIIDLIKDHKDNLYFWDFINRLVYEFQVFFPKLYSKYFKWCSYYPSLIKKEEMQEILLINCPQDFIKYFIDKF